MTTRVSCKSCDYAVPETSAACPACGRSRAPAAAHSFASVHGRMLRIIGLSVIIAVALALTMRIG
jgi:hypothetical protein